MRVIDVVSYKEKEIKEYNIVESSYEQAREKVNANHFIISLSHKLFTNVKASDVFNIKTDESMIKTNFSNINYENSSSERNIVLNMNDLYNDNNLKNKIQFIGSVPETFSKSFLSMELLLIQKMKKEDPNVQLSDYSQRLVKLCNSLYQKDVTEIVVDDSIVKDFINQQEEQFKDIQKISGEINKINRNLTSNDNEISFLSNEIDKKNKDFDNKEVSKNQNKEEIKSLKEKRKSILENSLTIIDKIKIKVFEKLGVSDIYDVVIKEKEKIPSAKLSENSNLIKSFEASNDDLDYSQKSKLKEINDFREKLAKEQEKKKILENTLIELEERKISLKNSIVNSSGIKDISSLADKNINALAKQNVFSIHVFPDFYPEETSPLKQSLNSQDKINAIRAFNPCLSTSTYMLNGEPFDNSTFGNGLRGVIIGKGNITHVTKGDGGSIVASNNERIVFGVNDLDEEINFLSKRSNKVLTYNEVVVSNSVPYAEIIQLDQYINDKARNMRVEKTDYRSDTKTWIDFIKKVKNEHKNSQYDMEPLPLVLMINGKLLEIQAENNFVRDEYPEKTNIKDLEDIIKKSFFVKEISDVKELTNVNSIIEQDIRKKIAKDLIGKYKNSVAESITRELKNKHDISLNI